MKNLAKKLLATFNLKMQRTDTPMRSLEDGLLELAKYVDVRSVIDIGVANGTPELYKAFPPDKYRYLLVEADPANRSIVESLARAMHADFEVTFCGAEEGSITLNTHENSEYSSAFTLRTARKHTGTVEVSVKTLDQIMLEKNLEKPYVIKIDVEGAELEVIKGAAQAFQHAEAIIIETSISKKYNGGAEFGDVVCAMREYGFSVFDILAGANRNNKLYQCDVVFVRTDAKFRT
jgi:FkbM family methyltransferase